MTNDVLQNEGLKGAVTIALTLDSAGRRAQKESGRVFARHNAEKGSRKRIYDDS